MITELERLTMQSLLIEVFGIVGSQVPVGRATGFVMATPAGRPVLMTARHNVTGRHQQTGERLVDIEPHEIAIALRTQVAAGNMIMMQKPAPRVRVLLRDQNSFAPLWSEHPLLGATADVVAVPISSDIPWVLTAEGQCDMKVGPSTRLSIVGFPFATSLPTMRESATWSTAFVASEPTENFSGQPVFLVDCRARTGQSGSPVYRFARAWEHFETTNGWAQQAPSPARLLGLYSGRISHDSDLGRVWKYEVIHQLLEAIDNDTALPGTQ
jgi:hypothetical protein